METDFWHNKWHKNEIGFHLDAPNPLLVKYFNTLSFNTASRVFLPLCGKTLDIEWLLAQGFQVVGAELSQLAVDDLFKRLAIKPLITQLDQVTHYTANQIDMYVGDIFNLSPNLLGKVDVIYDRAALVALPDHMRKQYSSHLIEITDNAPQLLICFEYEQNLHAGPPFSIHADEVKHHYQHAYDISLLGSHEVEGGLKGRCAATEHVWHLKSQ